MILRLLIASSLLGSCVAAPDALPSSTVDRATLAFVADGVRYVGTGVLPRQSRTRVTFELPDKVRELAISTCHREEFFTSPPKNFVYDYVPTMWLENWNTCLLKATAFTSDGKALLAILDWTSNEMLPATTYCNGVRADGVKGASFCQSRSGLTQMVTFSASVEARSPARCAQPYGEKTSEKEWRWFIDLSPGLCIYAFKDAKGQFHRLTTYGYTETM